jgi:hypothetical protein
MRSPDPQQSSDCDPLALPATPTAAPRDAATIERVLAIPPKRYERPLITFLTEPELDALINVPYTGTWTGRRDQAMLTLAVNRAQGIRARGPHRRGRHRGTGARDRRARELLREGP